MPRDEGEHMETTETHVHTRRRFVSAAGMAAAVTVVAPLGTTVSTAASRRRPLSRRGTFPTGVASGDPTPGSIILWTRLDGEESTRSVRLEIARDKDFRRVVTRTFVEVGPKTDHNVVVLVGNLDPREEYWYRFSSAQRSSRIGRFRTAPPKDSRSAVEFAFFSCQDYTHGFYNAHRAMARDEDLDFVVCLGDYIYAEAYHTIKGGTGVRDDRIGREIEREGDVSGADLEVARQAVTLSDYRAKYRLYRADEDLQAMHAMHPVVSTWDDHEVQNNYAGGARGGGLPKQEGFTRDRQRAGYRAFFEATPCRRPPRGTNRLYRSLRYGRTVDLLMLDQRQYRDNQPCGDGVVPACDTYEKPRDYLGDAQMGWAKSRLSSSDASWKIIGNEMMIMPAKVTGGAFYTFDNWQGYPTEREELLSHIDRRGIDDVVFVTGDIHTFIAGDVRRDMGAGKSVALEFVGGSITSAGLGEIDLDVGGGVKIQGNDANPNTPPAFIDTLRGINPWVDIADFDHHGYGRATASTKGLEVEMVRFETIKKRSTRRLPSKGWTYKVDRGQKSIKGVNGPKA